MAPASGPSAGQNPRDAPHMPFATSTVSLGVGFAGDDPSEASAIGLRTALSQPSCPPAANGLTAAVRQLRSRGTSGQISVLFRFSKNEPVMPGMKTMGLIPGGGPPALAPR